MNGSKSTFKRKGYWLTAFAAAVLLAASPGTAQAQVTTIDIESVEVDEATDAGVVAEGVTTRVTVTLTEELPSTVTGNATVTLTLQDPNGDALTTAGAAGEAETSDFTLAAGSVTIRAGQDSGSVVLITHHDVDAVDEEFQILASNLVFTSNEDAEAGSTAADPFEGEINDDEVQEYELAVTESAENRKEDAPLNLTLSANPSRPPNEDVDDLYFVAPGYTIDPTTEQSLTSAMRIANAEATPSKETDGNRTDDPLTISVLQGTVVNNERIASLTITVLDVHQLPTAITGEAKGVDEDGDEVDEVVTMVAEGSKANLYVTVVNKTDDRIADDEEFTLTPQIAASHGLDATLTPASMKFTGPGSMDGEKVVGPFTIEAVADEDVGMENLTVTLEVAGAADNGGGSSSGTFSIAIVDGTTPKIEAQDQTYAYPKIMEALGEDSTNTVMNPGQTGMIMTSDLFTVMDGYTASYGVSVEGDSVSASASGETITLNAISATVEGVPAKVTVTGTARMAGSSFMPEQTVSNVASITFPVTVVDTELVVEVTADPMEVEAGGTSTLTATANRAVTAGDGAVTVHLTLVGDGTVDPASITIAMGAMSGSAMLTANEMVTVVATGSGITAPMQVTVDVTEAPEPVPEPVPALPLIGQLLLGLGLLGGGARHLYRRRRQG